GDGLHHVRRRRNHLIIRVAELVAARAVVRVAELVQRDRVRVLRDEGDELAAIDLIVDGRPLVTVTDDAAGTAGQGRVLADVIHDVLSLGREALIERFAGDVVAHPEALAHDERLQLRIAQRRGTLLLQVGDGHARGRELPRLGARGV